MIRSRAVGFMFARQCVYQARTVPRIAPMLQPAVQMRCLSEQSWVQKISNFFYGKDDHDSTKGLKDMVNEAVDTAEGLTLQQYFKHMDKLSTMKKMGLGTALEKLVGVNLGTAQEKMLENHKKIKEFLTEHELTGTTFSLSPQRKGELESSTGLTAQDIDQITSMFSHIQQVKKAFDKAKSEGKIPQSYDELKEMIGGAFQEVTNTSQNQHEPWKDSQQEEGKDNQKQGQYQWTGQHEGQQGPGGAERSVAEGLGKEGETQKDSPFNTQRGAYGSNFGTEGSSSPYGSVGTAYGSGTSSSTSYSQGTYGGAPAGRNSSQGQSGGGYHAKGFKGAQGGQQGMSQGEYKHERFTEEANQGQSQGGQSFPSGYKDGMKSSYGTGGGYDNKTDYRTEKNKVKEGMSKLENNESSSSSQSYGNNKGVKDNKEFGQQKGYGENKTYGEQKGYGENKDQGEWAKQDKERKNDPGYAPSSSNQNQFGDKEFRGVGDKEYRGFIDRDEKQFGDDKSSTNPSTSSYASTVSSTSDTIYPHATPGAGPAPNATVGGQQGSPFQDNQTTQKKY